MSNVQFPYPRASASPSTYTTTRTSTYRQKRLLKTYAPPLAGGLLLLWLLLHLLTSSPNPHPTKPPPGTPSVVIITTLDPTLSAKQTALIKENRQHYASLHNYATFFPNTTTYDLLPKTPATWSAVPAVRHALALFPHTPWLWYLSSTALIMSPQPNLERALLSPRTLESHMIPDKPVVPPDSVIKTFSHQKGENVAFILTQDRDGLAGDSFLVRSGEWAKFFLDTWYDPLYRSYNFQKAEGHALEHIVQWHGTILARLALVPQRLLNSYAGGGGRGVDESYQEGDFVANFHGCQQDPARSCEDEMAPLISRWRELRDQERKRK